VIPQEKACKWLPLTWNNVLLAVLAHDLPQQPVVRGNQPYCVISWSESMGPD